MDKEVSRLITEERKRARTILELEKVRERVSQLKQPDQKLLAKIDKELEALRKV